MIQILSNDLKVKQKVRVSQGDYGHFVSHHPKLDRYLKIRQNSLDFK
jgi:hypothetical protein